MLTLDRRTQSACIEHTRSLNVPCCCSLDCSNAPRKPDQVSSGADVSQAESRRRGCLSHASHHRKFELTAVHRSHASVCFQLPQAIQREESSPDSELTSEVRYSCSIDEEKNKTTFACSRRVQMDDQLNDDTTCGSIDSTSRGISITPRVRSSRALYSVI